jgi:hypothetical protein
MNLNEVAARTAIRNAIQSGDIVKGVELVNELNPEVRVLRCSLSITNNCMI